MVLPEVGKRRRVLRGRGDAEGFEGLERDDPRRDGGEEVLAQKRPQRHVFPPLDVARAPVVDEHEPEDVLLGALDGDGLAQPVARPDEKAHLELEVQPLRRAEHGRVGGRWLHLPLRTDHVVAAHDEARRPPVVADGQVRPVGHEGVFRPAKHRPDVRGMLARRVKIGVITHLDGHPHLDGCKRQERLCAQVGIVLQPRIVAAEEVLERRAHRPPHGLPERHEGVERAARERRRLAQRRPQHPRLFEHPQIEHVVANPHGGTRPTRFGLHDAVRQVFEREERVGGQVEKRGHGEGARGKE